MRILEQAGLGASILLLAVGWAAAQPPGEIAQAGDFELRRVMLSTGGVGYFEYETRVSGEAALSFRVRRDQVDDVLKSVVVYDDEGRIGTISLPGQEPLREVFRGLPFEHDDVSSPAALFNALPEGGSTTRHRVSLVGDSGIQQVVLEEAGSISFTDPELAAQVEAALAAVARQEDADSRTLTVTMDGGGTQERTVRVAYLVEVPLWKATYRLTLSNDPGRETAALQGWAVLENLTGEDWRDVELSVVSGNPVTFRQALYEAYYVDRPEVPVEVLGRVLPRVDDGSIRSLGFGAAGNENDAAAFARAAPQAAREAEEIAVTGARLRRDDSGAPNASDVLAAESADAAAQVLFRVPQPVTIAAGDSVLVPIVARDVPARRVSLYQPETHPRHPLASVLLTNDTGTSLPPGVLTLYERDAASGGVSHVGDARLSPLPSDEDRLLSFAVDQEVTIDREDRDVQRIGQGRIADGVLELRFIDSRTTRYLISAAPGAVREIILEQPRRSGWELVDPADEQGEHELTETAYRLPISVAAGETVRLDTVLERPRLERIELAPLPLERVQVWAASDELSPDIRAALAELAELRRQVGESERAIDAAQQTRRAVVDDQGRIRENLNAVPEDSDLSRRYLDELSRQEDRLVELGEEIEGLRETLDASQRRLAEYVRSLSL